MKNFLASFTRLALAFAPLVSISCKSDNNAGPPVATTIAANSPTSYTGAVGAVVTPAPSVLVKDQNGSPMAGTTVTFAVASGGGSVSGATVTTDASGIATVGAWTLGPSIGVNVLNASSGSLNIVAFTATSTAGAAASIAKNAGDNQTAAAGSAVPVPPSVLVKDVNGNPKPDVSVTFAVASGGGSVTGATALTNASGIATVGSWTLGAAVGTNTLNATAGSLSTVVFTATSSAGAAASIVKNGGDNQSVTAGTAVPVPPSVLVRDANGNPKSNVSVTFAVVAGGGSITGATALTNVAGVATVGSWTLGAVGANSLSATVAGLAPVTFNAIALASLCNDRGTHTFGSSTGGTLSSTDCQLSDGSLVDFYNTSIPQAGAYYFRESAGFDTYLLLARPDGTTVAENDDDEFDAGTNSAIKALLPAGDFLLGATSFDPGETGGYTLSSSTAPSEVANCEVVFVVKNISTTQNITTADCNLASSNTTPIYADGYVIFLSAGTSITIDMTSSSLDSFLELRGDGLVVAQNDNRDGSTKDARITYTAPKSNYYVIFTRSVPTTAVGAYTLTIQ